MTESMRGQCLIAHPSMRDPNFRQTVVLLVEDNDQGSMGLVLNRPSTVLVEHALSGHFELPATGELVYVGGPVEPSALFILHNLDLAEFNEPEAAPGVYVGNSPQVFEEVVRRATAVEPGLAFRIFCGCAGWSPGQLQSELARGDWHLFPAEAEFVFTPDAYSLYDQVLQRMFAAHRLWPHPESNPRWN